MDENRNSDINLYRRFAEVNFSEMFFIIKRKKSICVSGNNEYCAKSMEI